MKLMEDLLQKKNYLPPKLRAIPQDYSSSPSFPILFHIYQYLYLSIYLSIYLFIYLSICLSIYMQIYLKMPQSDYTIPDPRNGENQAKKCFKHPLLTNKPATITQVAKTTMPPNCHKALVLKLSRKNCEPDICKFKKKCHHQTKPSLRWRQLGPRNVFSTLC